jgi:hypothetical protein
VWACQRVMGRGRCCASRTVGACRAPSPPFSREPCTAPRPGTLPQAPGRDGARWGSRLGTCIPSPATVSPTPLVQWAASPGISARRSKDLRRFVARAVRARALGRERHVAVSRAERWRLQDSISGGDANGPLHRASDSLINQPAAVFSGTPSRVTNTT